MNNLKIQHLIVMVALLVSLVGTLLLLGKLNTEAVPITGATAVVEVVVEDNPQEETVQEEEEYSTVVRVVGYNQTET